MKNYFTQTKSSKNYSFVKKNFNYALIVCILLVTTTVTGCSRLSHTEENTEEISSEMTTMENTNDMTTYAYTIENHIYKKGSSLISYPSLIKMTDVKKQKKINQMIKLDLSSLGEPSLSSLPSLSKKNGSIEKFKITVQYHISYSSEHLISILVDVTDGYLGNDSFEFGFTYDLDQVKRCTITDFVDVNMDFANQILNAETFDGIDSEKPMEMLQELGPGDSITSLLMEPLDSFVLGKGYIGIIEKTSLNLGKYIIVHVPYTIPDKINFIPQTYLLSENEVIIYGFQLKDSQKMVVLVEDMNHNYMTYLFGTKDNLELYYPSKLTKKSYDKFDFKSKKNQTVTFINKNYEYEIYNKPDWNNYKYLYSTGIEITNLSTKETVTLNGDPSTIVGYPTMYR